MNGSRVPQTISVGKRKPRSMRRRTILQKVLVILTGSTRREAAMSLKNRRTVQGVRHSLTGKFFPLICPSKKARVKVKAEIKALTCRRTLGLPTEVVIEKLNGLVRGWAGYFIPVRPGRDWFFLPFFKPTKMPQNFLIIPMSGRVPQEPIPDCPAGRFGPEL